MSNKKKRNSQKTYNSSIESSEIQEETPVSEPECDNTSEWLIMRSMQGTEIRCARCKAAVEYNKGSLTAALLKNKYCYNCGAKMILKEI